MPQLRRILIGGTLSALGRTCALGLAVSPLIVPQMAQAAQTGSILIGTVTDRVTKKPLAGVQVVVTSNSLQGEQTVETDSSGTYRIPNLPAGTYTVQFFSGNHKPFTNPSPITLRTGQTIRFNAPLQPKGQEEINIEVVAPSVDVTSTSMGASMDEEFIKRVPVVSAAQAPTKSFEAVALAAPGAQGDQYGTSISGTTSPENGYKIDGISVGNVAFGTNGAAISSEFLQEVQVISGGYMPEYGRSTGGTVAATTRTGSNEFHGSVWLSVSPGALEGKRTPIIRDTSAVVTQRKLSYIGDIGAQVNGPIIKDKLWFSAGVQLAQRRYKLTREIWARQFDKKGKPKLDDRGFTVRKQVDGVSEEFKTGRTDLQATARLTYALNQDHRISLSGLYMPSWNGGDKLLQAGRTNLSGRVDDPVFWNRTKTGSSSVTLSWLGTADNKRWTFDTRVAMHRQTAKTIARDGSVVGDTGGDMKAPVVSWGFRGRRNLVDLEKGLKGVKECKVRSDGGVPCDAMNYAAGGAGFLQNNKQTRYQLVHSTGRTFQFLGHHTVKAGLDIELQSYQSHRARSGKMFLTDRGSVMLMQRAWAVLHGPNKFTLTPEIKNTTSLQMYGAFIQDSWSIMDKVTLNAGVRYDATFIHGSDGNLAVALPLQLAPRVGLIWDPTQKGNAKIYANYARYFQGMTLNMADRSGGSVNASIYKFYNGEACKGLMDKPGNTKECLASGGPALNSHSVLSGELLPGGSSKTPIDPDIKPQSSDEVSAGVEYNVIPDGMIGLYYQKRWYNRIIEDLSRDDGVTYFIANPSEGIAKDFPKPVRMYDAVRLVLTKPYRNHWLVQGSYQWSHTRGNVDGLFRPESGQLDPNINSDFDLVSLLPNRKGDLAADRRHEIKAFGAGDYPISNRFSIDGGLAFEARSGRPTNYLGTHERYGRGESFLLTRGTGDRLPWQFNINVNLGATFLVGKSSRIQAGFEIFNIANFQQVTAIDQNWGLNQDVKLIDGGSGQSASDLKKLKKQVDKLTEAKMAKDNMGVDPNSPKFKTKKEVRAEFENPNYGNATAYQAPRSFRFNLRYEF